MIRSSTSVGRCSQAVDVRIEHQLLPVERRDEHGALIVTSRMPAKSTLVIDVVPGCPGLRIHD